MPTHTFSMSLWGRGCDLLGSLEAETHKLLSVVAGEEVLKPGAPVRPAVEHANGLHRLAHITVPRIEGAGLIRCPSAHQDIQAVDAEAPAGSTVAGVKKRTEDGGHR